MQALGKVWDNDPLAAMRLATEAGYVLAAELRACGVDLSFTPVLDLDYGVSKVIGNRAFHRDPRVVAMLARALAQGLAQARSEEHTSELQSLMRISYAVFCLNKKKQHHLAIHKIIY